MEGIKLEYPSTAVVLNERNRCRVNQVNAMLSSGVLAPAEGQSLLDAANAILAALGH